jgi:hypothetical protein
MTDARIEHVRACEFDALGTLLDFNSAVMHCADRIDTLSPLQDILGISPA